LRQFGLIGHPLKHSFSPAYFAEKFQKEGISNARYDAFDLDDISQFPGLLKSNPKLAGLNVTIPYKESVIPYLDTVDPVAAEIGSVNTILFSDGKTIGHNTDLIGISETLKPHLEWYMMTALILGTGGSAKTVSYFLRKIGIQSLFITRNPSSADQISYSELTEEFIQKHKLIINCSPVGMFPNVEDKPAIPYDGITDMHVLFDLIYNPPMTQFLQEAQDRDATTLNGSKMLRIQAEASWKLWNK
jgi:shikimate dehydrogenase